MNRISLKCYNNKIKSLRGANSLRCSESSVIKNAKNSRVMPCDTAKSPERPLQLIHYELCYSKIQRSSPTSNQLKLFFLKHKKPQQNWMQELKRLFSFHLFLFHTQRKTRGEHSLTHVCFLLCLRRNLLCILMKDFILAYWVKISRIAHNAGKSCDTAVCLPRKQKCSAHRQHFSQIYTRMCAFSTLD